MFAPFGFFVGLGLMCLLMLCPVLFCYEARQFLSKAKRLCRLCPAVISFFGDVFLCYVLFSCLRKLSSSGNLLILLFSANREFSMHFSLAGTACLFNLQLARISVPSSFFKMWMRIVCLHCAFSSSFEVFGLQ